MWIADGWKDYEVIDCSGGEKLERWGNYLLVRPDPQVIWDTPKKHHGWKKHERPLPPQQQKAAASGNSSICPQQWSINYKGPDLPI